MIQPIPPHPALLLRRKGERALIVADLHIGWEAALTSKGVHVPSQTPTLLDRLLKLIELHTPTRLIVLGDVKHTIANVKQQEWRDVPLFFEAVAKKIADIQVILGNHDGSLMPLLPETIEILPSTGTVLHGVGLFHGHTWPAPELLGCKSLVLGHIHPIVVFRDLLGFRRTRQVWVKAKCNGEQLAKGVLEHLGIKKADHPARLLHKQFSTRLKASQIIILPAFNEFLGGHPFNETAKRRARNSRQYISPILRTGTHLDDAEIYLFDGTFLGTAKQLAPLS